MEIKKQNRQGERNILERPGVKMQHVVDLNNQGYGGYADGLMSTLIDLEAGDTFLYHKTPNFIHMLEGGKYGQLQGVAYFPDFFPLDVKLSPEEVLSESALENLVDDMIDKHVDQFEKEYAKVKALHPDSPLFTHFCPSDSIMYENTVALPFYAFVVARADGFWLETESSYLIVPQGILSKAYGAIE